MSGLCSVGFGVSRQGAVGAGLPGGGVFGGGWGAGGEGGEFVGGFGVFGFVDARGFGFGGDAEAEGGADGPGDEQGESEGEPGGGEGGDGLFAELGEAAAVEQPVRAGGVDRGGGDEAKQEHADQAADSVDGHDVEGVVVAQPVFESDRQLADQAGHGSDEQGAEGVDVAAGRSDPDEAGDGGRGRAEAGRSPV